MEKRLIAKLVAEKMLSLRKFEQRQVLPGFDSIKGGWKRCPVSNFGKVNISLAGFLAGEEFPLLKCLPGSICSSWTHQLLPDSDVLRFWWFVVLKTVNTLIYVPVGKGLLLLCFKRRSSMLRVGTLWNCQHACLLPCGNFEIWWQRVSRNHFL